MTASNEQNIDFNDDHEIKTSHVTMRARFSWWREWRKFALRISFLPCFLAYFILLGGTHTHTYLKFHFHSHFTLAFLEGDLKYDVVTCVLLRKYQSCFICAGLWGAMMPTLSVYVRAKGFSADEMALLGFLSPLFALILRPAVAFLADKTHRHRLVSDFSLHTSAK